MMLDWINLDEFLPLVVLIGLLNFIGGRMAQPTVASVRITRRVAYVVFTLYALAALCSWEVSEPMDFLVIVLRASLATGLIYGLTLIAIPAIDAAAGLVKVRRTPESQPWTPPLPNLEPAFTPPKPEAVEHEPETHVDDARTEVTAFYEKHEEIHEALPLELFRSQIQGRFTHGLNSEQAWTVAQGMIADMLSKVAEARAKQRAEQELARIAEEQAKEQERKNNEPEERRQAVHKLTEWYQQEKEAIEQRLLDPRDRDDVLRDLFNRYDRLMKEALQEIRL